MRLVRTLALAIAAIMVLAALTALFYGTIATDSGGSASTSHVSPPRGVGAPTGWNVVERDTPVGDTFLIWEVFGGGWWSDAEKSPSDTEDDLLCWAATLSNIMEYTGWGYVGGMDTPDETLDYIAAHTTDQGTTIDLAFQWWVTGELPVPGSGWAVEDVQGGGFWPGYDWSAYTHVHADEADMMEHVEYNLAANRGTGLWITEIGGGGSHEITCWGVNVDTWVFDNSRWKGVWVTDSDSHKWDENAEDFLTYYSVAYDEGGGYWYMPHYGSGWKIIQVVGIDMFPGEIRPQANLGITSNNGEGSSVFFTAGGSDPDGDDLSYRWDWDGDGKWDTDWSEFSIAQHVWEDDYSGTVYVQVFDGRLTDMDSVEVVVANVDPTVEISMDNDIDEADTASLVLTLTEPGALDTLELSIDWDDGSPLETVSVMLGSTIVGVYHDYPDDDPTGTPYDEYLISVTVVDKDGGSGSDNIVLTVRSVAPVVSIDSMVQPNPFFILPLIHELEFHASFTDVGLLDTHSVVWDWGDGETDIGTVSVPGGTTLSATHTYSEPGTYTVTLTVTDDDTVAGSDTFEVVVNSAADTVELLDDYVQSLPESAFGKNPKIVSERKNAMHNMLLDIILKIDGEEYNGAIQDLTNNVKEKVDGLPTWKNSDWIVDPAAQSNLCMMIDDIVEYLALLMEAG